MVAFKFNYTVKSQPSQEPRESNSISFEFTAQSESELIAEAENMILTDIKELSEREIADLYY
jgi:hypothetical protein